MRLGIICRPCNSGLGTLSREFARNLKPDKVLIQTNGVFQTFPERYENIVEEEDFFKDLDVVMSFETFYDWSRIQKCRDAGIKSVLVPMFEMLPERLPLTPDLLLCPSKLDYDIFKDYSTKVEYLPIPVATDRLIWKKREKANVFVHSGSHGGQDMRKGTPELLQAMEYVKSDIKLIIYTWHNFSSKDPRVEIKQVNFKNYWQLWREGDVLVYPQGANGICLPIVEAMSSGMGVITTDIYPFNEYMPKDLLFKPGETYRHRMGNNLMEVEDYKIDPKLIAEKIDEVAGKDISEYSEYGKRYAEEHSWVVMLPKYASMLENLCTGQ